jgi:hypothetical protein
MRKLAVFACCLSLLVTAVAVVAAGQDPKQEPKKDAPKPGDISGVWALTVQTPQGEMTNDATFAFEKDVLKVVMAGPGGEPMNGLGSVKDGVVEWTVSISTPQGDFALVFKGKIDGDQMAGDVQMGDFGSSGWSARKKK